MWSRDDKLGSPETRQQMLFLNRSAFVILRKIWINIIDVNDTQMRVGSMDFKSNYIQVWLTPSFFKCDELDALVISAFKLLNAQADNLPKAKFNERIRFLSSDNIHIIFLNNDEIRISFELGNVHAIENFKKLFSLINTKSNAQEVPPEIFKEFDKLSLFYAEKKIVIDEKYHLIKPYVNPSISKHPLIAEYFNINGSARGSWIKELSEEELDEVKELLVKGADANLTTVGGVLPLWIAIINKANDLMELLLEYGANPLLVSQGTGRNSFEDAKYHKQPFKFEILSSLLAVPKKSLLVNKIEHQAGNETVSLKFQFENNTQFFICYKPLSQFIENSLEREAIFQLFKKTFKALNNDEKTTTAAFEYAFIKNPNKIICLIYGKVKTDQNFTLIGADLFEPLTLNNGKKVVIHGEYALLDPKYFGSGLGRLIQFILAYAAKFIQDALEVDSYYAAANWASYQWVGNSRLGFIFSPKYRSDHSDTALNDIILLASGSAKTGYRKNMAWHIQDEIAIKTIVDAFKPSYNISYQVFNKHVQRNNPNVCIPVRQPINSDNFSAFNLSLGHLGIELYPLIRNFSANLISSNLISRIIKDKKLSLQSWKNEPSINFGSAVSFWGNSVEKKAEEPLDDKKKVNFIRSKL